MPVYFFFGNVTIKEGVASEVVWVWSHPQRGFGPTFQSDGLRAVEVHQCGQGTAVRVVLQQVLHQGERRGVPLLGELLPVASLKPWQRHKDITYMCHRGGRVRSAL